MRALGLWIRKEITLGTILQALALLFAILFFAASVKTEVKALKDSMLIIDKRIEKIGDRLNDHIIHDKN